MLTGKSYCEARKMFDSAIPCGVLQGKTTKLWLNPSENYVLQDGDKMVLLAQCLDSAKLIRDNPHEIADWVKSVEHAAPGVKQRKVLVLSFASDCSGFLEAIGEFADESVEVDVVARYETLPYFSHYTYVEHPNAQQVTRVPYSSQRLVSYLP